jgi:hypothetical protein
LFNVLELGDNLHRGLPAVVRKDEWNAVEIVVEGISVAQGPQEFEEAGGPRCKLAGWGQSPSVRVARYGVRQKRNDGKARFIAFSMNRLKRPVLAHRVAVPIDRSNYGTTNGKHRRNDMHLHFPATVGDG